MGARCSRHAPFERGRSTSLIFLDVLDHPKPAAYPGQRAMVGDINGSAFDEGGRSVRAVFPAWSRCPREGALLPPSPCKLPPPPGCRFHGNQIIDSRPIVGYHWFSAEAVPRKEQFKWGFSTVRNPPPLARSGVVKRSTRRDLHEGCSANQCLRTHSMVLTKPAAERLRAGGGVADRLNRDASPNSGANSSSGGTH